MIGLSALNVVVVLGVARRAGKAVVVGADYVV